MYEIRLKIGNIYSVMECVPGDIIRGAGARAPQFIVTKVTQRSMFALDAYGNPRRFRRGLTWYKLKTGTRQTN